MRRLTIREFEGTVQPPIPEEHYRDMATRLVKEMDIEDLMQAFECNQSTEKNRRCYSRWFGT